MGGWVCTYYLFFNLIFYLKIELFLIKIFWLLNFLFNLTSQKDHLKDNKEKPLIKLNMFKLTSLV
jgi:hypothetical protein